MVRISGIESLQVPEQINTEPILSSENSDIIKKAKRVLSEKQREALKAGREKRWKRMFEALENQTELNKETEEPTHKDPLLEDVFSSSSSESSESNVPPEPIKPQRKKNKLPKKIRKRVDIYYL